MNAHDWLNDLVGRPWVRIPDPPRTFNCGELPRWVLMTKLGLDIPPIMTDPDNLREVCGALQDIAKFGDFRPVDRPADFDVVELYRGTRPDHVGLFFADAGGGVLHCQKHVGVLYDPVFVLRSSGWRTIRYYRHASFLEGVHG